MHWAFDHLVLDMALIFGGASIFGTLFVWLRQPIILAYILLGVIVGPNGASLMINDGHIDTISRMGIILLMFLLGLHLHPTNLFKQLKQTAVVTLLCITATTIIIWMMLVTLFKFSTIDAVVAGIALSFSSTVVSLKLIPTTTLHHRRSGEVMISILLFEDILAILTVLMLYSNGSDMTMNAVLLPLKTAVFAITSWAIVRYIVLPLFTRFDVISEYIFLMSLGWCFVSAEAAEWLGLSHEVGAFVAGVTLATSPVSLVIAEGLKPLREFFLILFFFSVGAQFDPFLSTRLFMAVVASALIILVCKPLLFKFLLQYLAKERPQSAANMGLRLGQSSEFSLLLASGALAAGKISGDAMLVIEGAAIITFIVSTYLVVFRLPTPISYKSNLRSD
ncbi:MAG: cation:proton antiporter [Endozoicomonas sp. (ex Botrylloides leachii)]|nr:cation:proton antiporter [Endozoicomonas sp. (ex Botrylloides leachii)]